MSLFLFFETWSHVAQDGSKLEVKIDLDPPTPATQLLCDQCFTPSGACSCAYFLQVGGLEAASCLLYSSVSARSLVNKEHLISPSHHPQGLGEKAHLFTDSEQYK